MLSIPLPRGFGLLVFVLPTYREPHKAAGRPLALPPLKGDLLTEARALFASGHLTAAAMTSRVELERLLTKLAMANPEFGRHWLGFQTTAEWLCRAGTIGRRARHATLIAADVGNRAAHGHPVTRRDVGAMFNAIESLRSAVARITTTPAAPQVAGSTL
jgi:hypothetical protein